MLQHLLTNSKQELCSEGTTANTRKTNRVLQSYYVESNFDRLTTKPSVDWSEFNMCLRIGCKYFAISCLRKVDKDASSPYLKWRIYRSLNFTRPLRMRVKYSKRKQNVL